MQNEELKMGLVVVLLLMLLLVVVVVFISIWTNVRIYSYKKDMNMILMNIRIENDTNIFEYLSQSVWTKTGWMNMPIHCIYSNQCATSHHQLLLPIHPNSLNLPQQPALLFIHKTNFTIHLQPISSKSELNSKQNPASCEIHNVSFLWTECSWN